MLPLGQIIHKHGINFHCYDKTEIIVVVEPKSLRHNLSAYMPNIDGISITSRAVIKDLGVTLDSDLAFDAHIKKHLKGCFL